jgi:hypothetical protein
MHKDWFASKLRMFMLVACTIGIGAGCMAENDPEDTAAEAQEISVGAAAAAEVPTPAPARSCQRSSDCFGDGLGSNLCCNHRCRKNFPGLRCLDQGGGGATE